MNGQMSSNEPTLFSFTANASGKIAHIINFNSSNAACSNSDTIPSSTVNTCLSTSEARTTATSTSYAGLNIDGTGTKDLSGATFYAYYGMAIVNGSGIFDIAALAAQGLNSSGTGDFTLTSDNPTFGVPVPSNSEDYHVVDFVQR